ncbi:MAG: RNA polymerase sigma factor [Candidatus Limnocylindrales bacterium]
MDGEPLAPPTGLSDADLEAAFRDHGPVLLAAARAITLDEAEAQDLMQTTFEIALRHRAELRAPGALRAWLLRIETREAFRAVGRLRRLVRLDGGVIDVPATGTGTDLAEALAVRQALRALPRRTRAVVILHHLVGLSVAETAAALGTSDNTVKTQLKGGLARLRRELGDE